MKEFKSKELFTIPNLMTFIRILLITPFVQFFLNEDFKSAAIVLIISGLTDCFDGYIARKFNQVTELGKVLDPIADKLTLLAITICFAVYIPIMTPFMIVLGLKDLLMLIAGITMIKKGVAPPAAKWYGKIGTILFYFSTILIVFLKAFFDYFSIALTCVLMSVTVAFMLFAFIKYSQIYRSIMKELKEENSEE